MKTIAMPWATKICHEPEQIVRNLMDSADVGSFMKRTLASKDNAFALSPRVAADPRRDPQPLHFREPWNPRPARTRAASEPSRARSMAPRRPPVPARRGSRPRQIFSWATERLGTRISSWKDHRNAERLRLADASDRPQICPGTRSNRNPHGRARKDPHQRRLAGAVLAD